MMETRLLGRSGIRASRLGLGCVTFGREIDEDQSFRLMDYAVEHGITLFDTAEAYGGGQARLYRRNKLGVEDEREVSGEMHSSEKIVGRWLRSRGIRDRIVLMTKVTTGFTRTHVREAIERSLERLETTWVDFYLYHQFDPASDVEEAAHAAADVVRAGLARAVGCSNYSGIQLQAALDASRALGLRRFEVVQSNYNLAVRDIERDVLPLAERESLGVVTYSPLAAGFLTGKYTAGIPKGSRFDVIPGHTDIYCHERNFALAARLNAFAARTGIPAAQVALHWVLRNPRVDTVLIGARNTTHLDNALAAISLECEFHDE